MPVENSPANSENLRDGAEAIVFLSCDAENSTELVRMIMADQPKAILLYSSIEGNCCSLQGEEDLGSEALLYTMADSREARETMGNTLRAGGVLRATITGDASVTSEPGPAGEQRGNNSAVAMSVLYSITGLVTLLFLVIVGTGALRARRYPERYGPQSGHGGRPRQSRARGLARAVLETLPIVKFGDPGPPKPDPDLELESHLSGSSSSDRGIGTRLSAIPEEPQSPRTSQGGDVRQASETAAARPEGVPTAEQPDTPSPTATPTIKAARPEQPGAPDERLGCTICTEDFTIGEDVRVLPCDHKFHPPCIDPWLVNISGTCPLW